MFFYFSRFLVRLGLPLYLKKLCVVNASAVPTDAPVLLASNHSGSFFDAVVIGSVVRQPIHTLTRGDVFRNPKAAFWLRAIKLIPVFRGSEGRENLKKIDRTLDECFSVMKNNGAVIIFSEGICVNEWNLRPLGKGTARMAHQAWYGEEARLHELAIVPTGVTYEHFRGANKRVILRFGKTIRPSEIETDSSDYEKWLREFNALLTERMSGTILEIPQETSTSEKARQLESHFSDCSHSPGNAVFQLLGKIGRAIHRPLYKMYAQFVATKTRRTVFYDSVLFGLLMYTYPIVVGLLTLVVGSVGGWLTGISVFVGLPLLALLGNRYRA
ncbi:1-acyl-sn-glycerol-3-phosphate acyltransferase [Persicitalea sp.]|uniref:1-acyl-sn-glycerol-3-phosphate acyltransferase n=1 Tax=Persicitalea sp. TaxID=3100273 RepID=UPI003593CD01